MELSRTCLSVVDRIGGGRNRPVGIRIGEAHRRHPQRHPPRSEAFLTEEGRAERQRWERVITSVELGHALVPSRMPRLLRKSAVLTLTAEDEAVSDFRRTYVDTEVGLLSHRDEAS